MKVQSHAVCSSDLGMLFAVGERGKFIYFAKLGREGRALASMIEETERW